MLGKFFAVKFDRPARHHRGIRNGQIVEETRVRLIEMNDETPVVEDLQAGNAGVVGGKIVRRLVERFFPERIDAGNFTAEHPENRAVGPPVGDAQQRINDITAGDFPRRRAGSAETGVGSEIQIVPQSEGTTGQIRIPLRHLLQHRRNQPVRTRRVIVLQQRIVDRRNHIAARQIFSQRRVKRFDPAAVGQINRLRRVGIVGRRTTGQRGRQQQRNRQPAPQTAATGDHRRHFHLIPIFSRPTAGNAASPRPTAIFPTPPAERYPARRNI